MKRLLLILLLPCAAWAEQVIIGGSPQDTVDCQDTYLRNGSLTQPNRNAGGATSGGIGRDGVTGTAALHWVGRFDLSSIPAGATNITATCSLYVTAIGGTRDYTVDTLETDFVEGTGSGGGAQVGSASWRSRGYVTDNPNGFSSVNGEVWGIPDTNWVAQGGMPIEAGVDTITIANGEATGYRGWDVTGIVNDMYNYQVMGTSTTGYGLFFRCTNVTQANNFITVTMSEHASNPTPMLVVNYDAPASAVRSHVIYVDEN